VVLKIALVYSGTIEYRTGILTVMENITKQLDLAGHQVYNICLTDGERAKKRGWYTVNGRPLTIKGELRLASKVTEMRTKEKFDIVHFQGGQILTVFKDKKIPYIITNHGIYSKNYEANAKNNSIQKLKGCLLNIIGRLLYRGADVVTSVSTATQDELTSKYHIPSSKMQVIPNGVDDFWFEEISFERVNDVKTNLGLSNSVPILFFLRPGEQRKGLHYLLEAMVILPGVHLLVAGDKQSSSYNETIDQLLDSYQIRGRVHFLGNIPQVDLPVYYKMANLTILPSIYEAFPMVALESYACGTPVVAFDVGGVSDLVDNGKDGILVKMGDVEALANEIAELLSDPQKLAIMGQSGKQKVVTNYSWESIAKRYLDLYSRSF